MALFISDFFFVHKDVISKSNKDRKIMVDNESIKGEKTEEKEYRIEKKNGQQLFL